MRDITVETLREKIDNKESLTLIDVREHYEHQEFNIGGELIPLGEFVHRVADLDINQEALIVIYCRSGHRSGIAKHLMEANGYKKVSNLLGGMLAWEKKFGR
jgi:rhodanese-related sulfurtransferase